MITEIDNCAGGIVIGDGGTIALVHNKHTGTWGFPKGGVEGDETDEAAARREITEETGITELEFIDDLGTYERDALSSTPEHKKVKQIHLYLFAAPQHSPLAPSLEIAEARWVPMRDVAAALTIPKDQAFFAMVFDRVREAIQRD